MDFFSSGGPQPTKSDAEESKNKKPKGKNGGSSKKKGDLSSIIDESVVETALAIFETIPAFKTSIGGRDAYVGLQLPTERIGGLDRKSSMKDAGKGQLVECMKNDEIEVYATQEMLADSKILFIPTEKTLGNMDEYEFLRKAEYDLVAVDFNGEPHDLGKTISFTDAVRIGSGEAMLSDFTDINVMDYDEEDDTYADDDDEDELSSSFGDDYESIYEKSHADFRNGLEQGDYGADPLDSFSPEFEQNTDQDENLINDFDDDIPFDDVAEPETAPEEPELIEEPEIQDSNTIGDGEGEDGNEETEDDPEEEVVDENQVLSAVTRRFFSDGLDLEVSSAPFDMQFMRDDPGLAFSENYDERWLSQYLYQMATNGNKELARLHNMNILRLRKNYFNLVARSCEDIQKGLDLSSSASGYGAKLKKLEELKNRNIAQIQSEISQRKAELNKEYDERKKQYVNNAMSAAEMQFDNMHSRQHLMQLNQLEPAAYARLESEYQEKRREILGERKLKAGQLLDSRINDIMQILTDEYQVRSGDEQARYEEIQRAMQAFIDENRKDEIAHTQVLADDMSRSNKVEQVIAEYNERVEALQLRHNDELDALRNEIEVLKQAQETELINKEATNAQKIEMANAEIERLNALLDEANEKYYSLDEKKTAEYKERIAHLEEEKKFLSEKMDNVVEAHKKSNTVYVFLIIAILVAALSIGFISGQATRSAYSNEYNRNIENIVNEYQQRMDDLEKKYGYTPGADKTPALPENSSASAQ